MSYPCQKKQMFFKPTKKNLEAPLQTGFRRAVIKTGDDRIMSVYYIAPDNTYLKNISDVCEWIEHEKKGDTVDFCNFNFVPKKYTSHENEFIIEYTMLPSELKDGFIEKKRSVAPTILTVSNDEVNVPKLNCEIKPFVEIQNVDDNIINEPVNASVQDNGSIARVEIMGTIVERNPEMIFSTPDDLTSENEVMMSEVISENVEIAIDVIKIAQEGKNDDVDPKSISNPDNFIKIGDENEETVVERNSEIILSTPDDGTTENNVMMVEVVPENVQIKPDVIKIDGNVIHNDEDLKSIFIPDFITEIGVENGETMVERNLEIILSTPDDRTTENDVMMVEVVPENVQIKPDLITIDDKVINDEEGLRSISNPDNVKEISVENEETMVARNSDVVLSTPDEGPTENDVMMVEVVPKNIQITSDVITFDDEVTHDDKGPKSIHNDEHVIEINDDDNVSEYLLPNIDGEFLDLMETKLSVENRDISQPQRKRHNLLDMESTENADPLPDIPEPVIGPELMIPTKRMRLDDTPTIELDDNSLTLSVESTYKDDDIGSNVVSKPMNPYEYPLAVININSLVEIGTNSHVDRIQVALNGSADPKIIKSIKSYCGNHCAFDVDGHPKVAFECEICLILWHNDCVGHRFLTVGPSTLTVCDNCYILHKNLNVELPNIFCDIEQILQSEFKPEMNFNPSSVSIPAKLESIFKLCKVNWILEKVTRPSLPPADVKVPKKQSAKSVSKEFPKDCRFFIKIFITNDLIVHDTMEDHILLKFNVKEVDHMASIFADSRAEVLINDHKFMVIISKIAVRVGELVVPVAGRISMPGFAVFYSYEYGQDSHPDYVKRCDNLKTLMCNGLRMSARNSVAAKDCQGIMYNQLTNRQPINICTKGITKITPVRNCIQGSRVLLSSTAINKRFTSITSSSIPKNAIPISMSQIKNLPNIIKIRQRKQDFSGYKPPLMASNSSTVQYYHLVDMPFSVLEKILNSKCLSTMDKLNCRQANRVLKCAVDGGHAWSKVVINPELVTGLQMMFDFFSKRNVRSMTFKIDFEESFGIEFFTSFMARLKMYPESFNLEKLSIKMTGINYKSSKFNPSLQDILSCMKSLKTLSLSCSVRTVIGLGKTEVITSPTLETLKLRNIDNIYQVMRTTSEMTPNLRKVRCGDWSYASSLDVPSFSHVTHLTLNFSDCVTFAEVSVFSRLTNIEQLIVARPRITGGLFSFLEQILVHASLKSFRIDTELGTKEQLVSCRRLGTYLPAHIPRIRWNIFISYLASDLYFRTKIREFVLPNVDIVLVEL